MLGKAPHCPGLDLGASDSPSDTDTEDGITSGEDEEDSGSACDSGAPEGAAMSEGERADGAVELCRIMAGEEEAGNDRLVFSSAGLDRSSSGESSMSPRLGACPALEGAIGVPGRDRRHGEPFVGSVGRGVGSQGLGGLTGLARGPVPTTTGAGPSREGGGVLYRSQYRGVSYDKKKRKWRVQIKVAALGKSGVSVGYFETEESAARAYDRAAIGLLGPDSCRSILNFPLGEYDTKVVPRLVGKSREEVKTLLKNERSKLPRRRLSSRRRTSKYLGVGSSNRKNQWQARILYHGKVTHLGYYPTEEMAARVYDRVSISLHQDGAETNFPIAEYKEELAKGHFSGMSREELQRALGVKPMNKSSKFRGVSKKKGRWEAKVMVNRKWAYRELFDTEMEAAQAYDAAVWKLKPREAKSYINFKDSRPADIEEHIKAHSRASSLTAVNHSQLALASVNCGQSMLASAEAETPHTRLQRYNSAPSPRALSQPTGAPGSSSLASRNSLPAIMEAPRLPPLPGAGPPKLDPSNLPPPRPPCTTMLRPVNEDAIRARSAELRCGTVFGGGAGNRTGFGTGPQGPVMDRQDLSTAISEATLAPGADLSSPELTDLAGLTGPLTGLTGSTLMPEEASGGPLLLRVGSEAHLIGGMPGQQVVAQHGISDAGVYVMLRHQDRMDHLGEQPGNLSRLQALANLPTTQRQDHPLHALATAAAAADTSQLEPSPFAVAAEGLPEGRGGLEARAPGCEGVGWNLGNVMFSDRQMPTLPASSLTMMNLEQVLHANQRPVTVNPVSHSVEGMGEPGQVKMDPSLLGALVPGTVDRDIVMGSVDHRVEHGADMGQYVGQEMGQYQCPQVRLEDVLAMVEPRDQQVCLGNDVDVELLLRSMSEQSGLPPPKAPLPGAMDQHHMQPEQVLQMTNDEIIDELMAPVLTEGVAQGGLGRR
eukprot:evm.model.scf_346.5 EVM.evm.TU.scf_346.5   scf_346:61221-74038(-)